MGGNIVKMSIVKMSIVKMSIIKTTRGLKMPDMTTKRP